MRSLPWCPPAGTYALDAGGDEHLEAAIAEHYDRQGPRRATLHGSREADLVVLVEPGQDAVERANRLVAPGGTIFVVGATDGELIASDLVLSEVDVRFALERPA